MDPLDDPHSREFYESSQPYSPEEEPMNGWIVAGILGAILLAVGVGAVVFFWNVTFRG